MKRYTLLSLLCIIAMVSIAQEADSLTWKKHRIKIGINALLFSDQGIDFYLPPPASIQYTYFYRSDKGMQLNLMIDQFRDEDCCQLNQLSERTMLLLDANMVWKYRLDKRLDLIPQLGLSYRWGSEMRYQGRQEQNLEEVAYDDLGIRPGLAFEYGITTTRVIALGVGYYRYLFDFDRDDQASFESNDFLFASTLSVGWKF